MKLPIQFPIQSQASAGIQSDWAVQTPTGDIAVSVPKEFAGPGTAASPEDLFAAALSSCIIGTFKVYAENSRLTFDNIQIDTTLTVDNDENKFTFMKAAHFNIKLTNPNNADKAQLLINKVLKSGFILNSVKTTLTADVQIV